MRNEELRIWNFLTANSTIDLAAAGCVETRSRSDTETKEPKATVETKEPKATVEVSPA